MFKLQSRNIYHKTETFYYFGPFSNFFSPKTRCNYTIHVSIKNNICILVCSVFTLHLLSKKIHTLPIFPFREF